MTVSPDTSHSDSLQVYPRVRSDGRGTVFVSWYDTRYKDGTVVGSPSQIDNLDPYYDLYTAYSMDGGQSWTDVRLSKGEPPWSQTQQAYFLYIGDDVGDYSGMTTNATHGTSDLCVLAMGRASGQSKIGIHAFKVLVRALGDYDGDFDVDCNDDRFYYCMSMPAAPECESKLLDMDQDGNLNINDISLFDQRFSGSMPNCHGPCQTDPGCNGYPYGMMSGDSGASSRQERPRLRGCELALSFVTYAAPDSTAALVHRFDEWLRLCADDPAAAETHEFLECLRAAL